MECENLINLDSNMEDELDITSTIGNEELAENIVNNIDDENFKKISESLDRIENLQQKNNKELTEMNKKYHNGFANVINNQQDELDKFREGLLKSMLNHSLSEIARIYRDYNNCVNFDNSDNIDDIRKNFSNILEELLQFLHENDVEEYKSTIGERYSSKYCKITGKEPTGEKEKNGIVIESQNTGLYREKIVLIPEYVKIYIYDKNLDLNENSKGE